MTTLSELISAYQKYSNNISIGITQIDLAIVDTQGQIDVIENDIKPSIVSDLISILEAKITTNNWLYYWVDPITFGDSEITSFILTDVLHTDLTYIDNTSFYVNGGDYTSFYTTDINLLIDCGVDGVKHVNVVSSSFVDGKTTVIVSGDSLTSNIVRTTNVVYEYEGIGWDNDTLIIQDINDFNTANDNLNKSPGIDGTYGLYSHLNSLNLAKTTQTTNKSAYDNFIASYSKFV